MNKLARNNNIAESLIAGMGEAGLEFQLGEIPQFPVSVHESVIKIWYSPNRILSHDLDELLNFANPSAYKLFGYFNPYEFLGMPSINLVPNDPELRAKRAEDFRKIIETGKPKHFKDSPRVRRDGSIVPVTGWAFRYRLDGQYSIGALLEPNPTQK